MQLINALQAFYSMLSFLLLPGFVLQAFGAWWWWQGRQEGNKDRVALGRLLALFGTILIIILLIIRMAMSDRFGLNDG